MRLCITLANTHYDTPKAFYDAFGGALYPVKKPEQRYKQQWKWMLHKAKDIQLFLDVVAPFLIVKRLQAEAASLYVQTNNRTWAGVHHSGLDEGDIALRRWCYERVKTANSGAFDNMHIPPEAYYASQPRRNV